MTTTKDLSTSRFRKAQSKECSTTANVTRSLLGYLALAGPFYVVVSLAQAFTRPGFNASRDEWSLLALGHLGWIQVTNLILTGAMTITGAVGVRRALGRAQSGGTWAPRLLVGYGLALISAGIFRADAANGFPAGTPLGRSTHVSWHGTLHVISGSLGFACLIALCFVVARTATRRGSGSFATISRSVGLVFFIGFVGIASGTSNEAVNLGFTGSVIASDLWLSWWAVNLYRRTRLEDRQDRDSSEGRQLVVNPSI